MSAFEFKSVFNDMVYYPYNTEINICSYTPEKDTLLSLVAQINTLTYFGTYQGTLVLQSAIAIETIDINSWRAANINGTFLAKSGHTYYISGKQLTNSEQGYSLPTYVISNVEWKRLV